MPRKRSKSRGGGVGSSAHGGQQQIVPPGSSSGATGDPVQATDPIEDLFLSFFEQYREGNDNVMFYRAELAAMTLKESSVLRIDYHHIMEHSPELAFSLVSDTERTKDLIANAFKRFIPQDSYLHTKELTVYCYNYPVFERKELLLEFLTSNPPVVAFRLHDSVETPVCSPSGSTLFQGYVDYLLTHHRKGLTWNGDFQASDMVILTVNGRYEFHILKRSSPCVDHAAMTKDFNRLANVLLHHYTLNTSGVHNVPPFFTKLCTALQNIPADVPSNAKSMDKFTMFLCNHMAFLPSISRSNLIYNLMRVYKAMGPNDQRKFEQAVNGLNLKGSDWRRRIQMEPVFVQVIIGRPVSAAQLQLLLQQPHMIQGNYGTSGMELLRFQRNFIVHAGDYLKDIK